MRIRAKDLAEMLRKMDEVEEKARGAFFSYSKDDQKAALEGLGEMRQTLYSVLAASDGEAWKGEDAE